MILNMRDLSENLNGMPSRSQVDTLYIHQRSSVVFSSIDLESRGPTTVPLNLQVPC